MASTESEPNGSSSVDTIIVGAGIVGIACAWYLAQRRPHLRIALVDPLPPMSLTSAASGENYRSIWPREEIGALTRRSIELMEDVARETDNRINMTRRGYLYVSRCEDPKAFASDLSMQYPHGESGDIRVHENIAGYQANETNGLWDTGHDGIDVLCGSAAVREAFPHLDESINAAAHARRAGDISSQQLGQYFLERLKAHNFRRVTGRVVEITAGSGGFKVDLEGDLSIRCDHLINTAGPESVSVAALLDQDLPLKCVAQQKIAFVDRLKAVPRDAPFVIDLDAHHVDWPTRVLDELASDADSRWLIEEFAGGIHCRPDGGLAGDRIKLGWAFNQTPTEPQAAPALLDLFPELVIRGAARANPALAPYIEHLPAHVTHYGGYYTKTDENWPLIGPLGVEGAFVATGLSGYGTMAACATGELIAAWVCGDSISASMRRLGLERYEDTDFMAELKSQASSGEL